MTNWSQTTIGFIWNKLALDSWSALSESAWNAQVPWSTLSPILDQWNDFATQTWAALNTGSFTWATLGGDPYINITEVQTTWSAV